MTWILRHIILIGIILNAVSCKKAYIPEVISSAPNYLVVEGFINLRDSTFIKLSRTVSLTSASTNRPEVGAKVTIESNNGSTYFLAEKGAGAYAAPSFNLPASNEYRLRITTINSNVYVSDFVQAKVSPGIDTVNTSIQSDGVRFWLSTHDALSKTTYYMWDYVETWEFNTFLRSNVYYDGTILKTRASLVDHCWGNRPSSVILLASTVNQSGDVINKTPITFVESWSEKLTRRYSILIRQYPLTKAAYDYYDKLKANTEALGSPFDPLPSSIAGNVRNTSNGSEQVIGYVSAGTISSKRIFISESELPTSYRTDYAIRTPYNITTCQIAKLVNQTDDFFYGGINPLFIPVDYGTGVRLGECADCTLRGTLAKPSFW